MKKSKLSLLILPDKLAICRLEKDSQIPSWAKNDNFFSITKTNEELSIVCSESNVPNDVKVEKNWRAFKIVGSLDFSLIGILASLANPLAKEKISIFTISTFNTDYVLVKDINFGKTIKILSTFCDIQNRDIL